MADMKETVMDVVENVEALENTASEIAEETKESVKEAVKEAKKRMKKTAKKTTEKAAETAKKAAKTVKKTVGRENEVYFQVFGNEYKESDIIEKVEEAYKADGHRVGTIKSLKLYIKPEENAAYYVINEKNEGKVTLL